MYKIQHVCSPGAKLTDSEGIGNKEEHNAKDAHLTNLSQHVINMGTLFVSTPEGRGNSGDGLGGELPKTVKPLLPAISGFAVIGWLGED